MIQQLTHPAGIALVFSVSYIKCLNLHDKHTHTPTLSHAAMATVIRHIDATGLSRTLCSSNVSEQLSELHLRGRILTPFNIYSREQRQKPAM